MLAYLRSIKHKLFLLSKAYRRARTRALDTYYRIYDKLVPFHFRLDTHRNKYGELPRMYFLHRDPPPITMTSTAPRVIYAIWAGENAIPEARTHALQSIAAHSPSIPLSLITPGTLQSIVRPDHPLHRAYNYLSLNHRSDYLRAYIMHYSGGGYTDVKFHTGDWVGAFNLLESDSRVWMVGYQPPSSNSVGGRDPYLGPEIRRRYARLLGFGAFACRSQTPLTAEWLREVERRLSYYEEALRRHPGNALGSNDGYPIDWIELGIDIIHPLHLKYNTHLAQCESVRPLLYGHR